MSLKHFAMIMAIVCAFIVFIALARVALHGDEAFGTWKEDEHISSVWSKGFAALPKPQATLVGGHVIRFSDGRDREALRAAQNELYAISTDEHITPACRQHADAVLVALILLDEWERYGESFMLGGLNQGMLQRLPIMRSQCQFSI